MSSEPRVWGVIPAAGVGRRMGGELPKQYLRIGGHTLLEHAASALLGSPRLAALVLGHAADDTRLAELPLAADPRVYRVVGGRERSDTVRAALAFLADRAGPEDWVFVHDAARPCLPRDVVETLLAALGDEPVGGIVALPVTDTVKRADPAGHIAATLPREQIWRAQTPQVFRYGVLWRALEAAATRRQAVTDDCAAVEALGLRPRLLAGSPANIKVTHPGDLALAAWYLAQETQRTR